MLKRTVRSLEPSEPLNCQLPQYVELFNSHAKMLEYLTTESVKDDLDAISAYIGSPGNSLMETDMQAEGEAATTRESEIVNKAVDLRRSLSYMLRCLQGTIMNKQAKMAQIYDLQKQLTEKEQEAKEKETIAATAAERAESVQEPYAKTTRWESWFPLDRPMRQLSIPVLLGISVFLLVMSVGIFLRLASIELHWTFMPFQEARSSMNIYSASRY